MQNHIPCFSSAERQIYMTAMRSCASPVNRTAALVAAAAAIDSGINYVMRGTMHDAWLDNAMRTDGYLKSLKSEQLPCLYDALSALAALPESDVAARLDEIDAMSDKTGIRNALERLLAEAGAAGSAAQPDPIPQRDYTVCFLFDPDISRVLLQTKAKTDFRGRLNGVGGKLEPGETPEACARREILEETGVPDIRNLTWLGTLNLPDNCDNHAESHDPSAPACVLHYYAGIIRPDDVRPPEGAEKLEFRTVISVLAAPVTDSRFAGNGDLQYFVGRGLAALSRPAGTEATHE